MKWEDAASSEQEAMTEHLKACDATLLSDDKLLALLHKALRSLFLRLPLSQVSLLQNLHASAS